MVSPQLTPTPVMANRVASCSAVAQPRCAYYRHISANSPRSSNRPVDLRCVRPSRCSASLCCIPEGQICTPVRSRPTSQFGLLRSIFLSAERSRAAMLFVSINLIPNRKGEIPRRWMRVMLRRYVLGHLTCPGSPGLPGTDCTCVLGWLD